MDMVDRSWNSEKLIVVRGAGDLASGVINKLVKSGFQVVAVELEQPSVIRRTVAYANAMFEGTALIEGVEAVKAADIEEALAALNAGKVPVLADTSGWAISELHPKFVVDAIIAKKNLGTHIQMAPIVVGLGPGFTAGVDVHAVVETNRGHYLGRVILNGSAEPDTGKPGTVCGFSSERVVRAPVGGIIETAAEIGDDVRSGQTVATVEGVPVTVQISGVLRGLIHGGFYVTQGMKIGDVDPRGRKEYCFTISDKARAIAGGVLEALLYLQNRLS
jgi:xanthine dehydrogenase accessory factor